MAQLKYVLLFLAAMIPAFAFGAKKVKVGSSPTISSIGLYLAAEKGFFKDQGLDVEITDVANSGAPMTLLLAKGELDVGAGNLTSGLFNAIAQGQQVKLVADKGHIAADADYIQLIVRKDHLHSGRFKELKDLKGFKLGLTALDGVSQQILTERFLKKAGLQEKDIEYVKLSYAEMNTALKTKSVDASVQLEPFLANAEKAGIAEPVAKGSEVYPNQQSASILYSPRFAKDRGAAVKFMVAYLKAVRLYNRSQREPSLRKEIASLLKGRLKLDEAIWEKMNHVGLTDDGRMNLASLDADLDWYRTKGFLKENIKATDVVDVSFSQEAAKILDGK